MSVRMQDVAVSVCSRQRHCANKIVRRAHVARLSAASRCARRGPGKASAQIQTSPKYSSQPHVRLPASTSKVRVFGMALFRMTRANNDYTTRAPAAAPFVLVGAARG
eukprot:scaffold14832_cov129-Isochrysis_galbana.AAC.1